MMFIRFLYFFLIPVLIGYFFLRHVFKDTTGRINKALMLILSFGAGQGLTSVLFFLSLVVFENSWSFIPTELSALMILVLLVRKTDDSVYKEVSSKKSSVVLKIIFAILLTVSVVNYLSHYLVASHGDWDAWTIWNLRPRFIFRTGGLGSSLSGELAGIHHQDYPLLLPGLIARGWFIVGHETTLIPFFLSFTFFYALVGLIYFAVSNWKGPEQGIFCTSALLISPEVISHSANQYADLPLGFFISCSLCGLLLYESENSEGFLFFSGIFAGCAAWTKNEGLLFAFLWLAVRFTSVAFMKIKLLQKEAKALLKAVVPLMIVVLGFKYFAGTGNYFLNELTWGQGLERLLDTERYLKVLSIMTTEFLKIFPIVNFPFLLPVYLLLVRGKSIDSAFKCAYLTGLITFLMMVTVYFFSYLMIYGLFEMEIKVSFTRLLFQIWPSALILLFIFLNNPTVFFESCIKSGLE